MASEKPQKIDTRETTGKSPSGDVPSGQDIFDVRKIRRLVELMKEYDLSQMDLRQGGPADPTAARVRAGGGGRSAAGGRRCCGGCRPRNRLAASPAAPAEDAKIALIRSPMVGTFYAASDPESPPYVKVGDHVGPETTVCIVEAMKVFNEIPAETSGKIMAVLVENGAPVEFGQPLFKVDTRG